MWIQLLVPLIPIWRICVFYSDWDPSKEVSREDTLEYIYPPLHHGTGADLVKCTESDRLLSMGYGTQVTDMVPKRRHIGSVTNRNQHSLTPNIFVTAPGFTIPTQVLPQLTTVNTGQI